MLEKTASRKVDKDAFVVSSNNESKVISKKGPKFWVILNIIFHLKIFGWIREVFTCLAPCKISCFHHIFPRLKSFTSRLSPFGLLEVGRSVQITGN